MNKIEIKEKEMEKNPSQQTILNVPQNEKENLNLEKLHVQRKKWKGNNIMFYVGVFFMPMIVRMRMVIMPKQWDVSFAIMCFEIYQGIFINYVVFKACQIYILHTLWVG